MYSRSDLSRDRAEQRPERFQVGDKVDARVTNVDAKTRRLGLSIKAREIAEEKEAVEPVYYKHLTLPTNYSV